MKHILFILILVASLASAAGAQTKLLITSDRQIDGQYIFGKNAAAPPTIATRELSATNPTVTGMGRGATVIKHDGTGSRFISTANFSTTTQEVANCTNITLDGNKPVPVSPYNSTEEWQLLETFGGTLNADGFAPKVNLVTTNGLRVQNCRGVGISLAGGDGHIINDVDILLCWTGVRLNGDHGLSNSQIVGVRDAGVHAVAGGNNWTTGVHVFGAAVACYNHTQGYRSTGDVFADCYIGYLGGLTNDSSIRSIITGTTFQYCVRRSIVALAAMQSFSNCYVQVPPEVSGTFDRIEGTYSGTAGIEVKAGWFQFLGGMVRLHHVSHAGTPTGAATGIWINGADASNSRIETILSELDNLDGATGIKISGQPTCTRLRIDVHGFTDANDKLLVIEDAGLKGLDAVLYVTGDLYDNPEDHMTLAAGWSANNNVITVIDTATGASKQLTE